MSNIRKVEKFQHSTNNIILNTLQNYYLNHYNSINNDRLKFKF